MVEHTIDADATMAALDKIVGRRGNYPDFIRCDNGPELTANEASRTSIGPAPPWGCSPAEQRG